MYICGLLRSKKKDKEAGISRGIDFQNVSNIVNFDFPPDVNSYIHRVGRSVDVSNVSFVNNDENFDRNNKNILNYRR